MKNVTALSIALAISVSQPAFAASPLDACGETVDDAILVADLDCSASLEPAVSISADGRLDLAGHTIAAGRGGAIYCDRDCLIEGNGGKVAGPNPSIDDPHFPGVFTRVKRSGRPVGSVTVSNLEITGFGYDAMVGRSIAMQGCSVHDNLTGVYAKTVAMSDSAVSAIHYQAVSGRFLEVTGSVIFDTLHGIMSHHVTLVNTTISGLDGLGVSGSRIIAYDSVLTGNCQAFDDPQCKDIYASRRPILEGTVCDTSWNSRKQEPWGVCTTD